MKKYNITVNGQTYAVEVEELGADIVLAWPSAQIAVMGSSCSSTGWRRSYTDSSDAGHSSGCQGRRRRSSYSRTGRPDSGSYEDGKRDHCSVRWYGCIHPGSQGRVRQHRRHPDDIQIRTSKKKVFWKTDIYVTMGAAFFTKAASVRFAAACGSAGAKR